MSEFRMFSRRQFLQNIAFMGIGAAIDGLVLPSTLADAAPAALSVISTAEWGAAAPKEAITVLNARPNRIILHHTTSPNTNDFSRAHAYQLARSIQRDHFAKNWIDSGQQFTISRGGYILEARHRSLNALRGGKMHVRGAHCNGQNDVAVGIENEGTYTFVAPPQQLYDQLIRLCTYVCLQYGIHSSQIYGHRDFNNTQCPGDRLYALLPQIRRAVAANTGDGGGNPRVWPLMQRGNTGERVKTLQYLLKARLSISLTTDGSFGINTEAAVKQFQATRNLPADGMVGPDTWEAIILTLRRDSVGAAVRAAQSQLASDGYGVVVDGKFGPNTEATVRLFQQQYHLTVDGVIGPNTWSVLVNTGS